MPLDIAKLAPDLRVDDLYARLVALGSGQSDEEARCRLSALSLVLMNHIGDQAVIDAAIDLVLSMPPDARAAGGAS